MKSTLAAVCFGTVLVAGFLVAGIGYSGDRFLYDHVSFRVCIMTQADAQTIRHVLIYTGVDGHFEVQFTPASDTPFGKNIPCTDSLKVKLPKGQVNHMMATNYQGNTEFHELKIGSGNHWTSIPETTDHGRFVWDVLPVATDRPTINMTPEK
ncbi:hypothetical protein IT408_00130 [Candidatus Uhrbacteria bacterium]|nr:hypothetical protein [Candidatus Uhrbacteria bacterium]